MFDFFQKKRGTFKNDILSGITVALALVPEAVAFSFVAGVEPQVGLFSAFMVGLIAASFGGRPGMISGATGAVGTTDLAGAWGIGNSGSGNDVVDGLAMGPVKA